MNNMRNAVWLTTCSVASVIYGLKQDHMIEVLEWLMIGYAVGFIFAFMSHFIKKSNQIKVALLSSLIFYFVLMVFGIIGFLLSYRSNQWITISSSILCANLFGSVLVSKVIKMIPLLFSSDK